MKFKAVTLLLIPFLILACTGESETDLTPQLEADSPQEQFFANLFELCGETFSGEATFPDDTDHELVGVELSATIETCTEEEIRIPFHAGEDESRTWVLSRTDQGMLLKHDHRYPDGAAHDTTDYGGYANNEGSATVQYFPADEQTAEMIPEVSTNVWMLELEPENDRLIYNLERNGEPRFRAELLMN